MSQVAIGARLGAGREADVHAWGPDAVVKLYRPGYLGHRAEALVLAQLDGHAIAPALIDIVDHEGRRGLVLERLRGPDMLTLLQRQPWRMRGLARGLAGAHQAIHQVTAPPELPDLRQVLSDRVEAADLPPQLRDFVQRVLDRLPSGDRLCHGDLHPGNVLVADDRVGVIDWGNACRGVPEADHARTLLLLRWADPLPGTSAVFRGLMAAGRSVFARTYTRAYGSATSAQDVDSWLTVQAAARLTEGIDVERPTLIGLLSRTWREAAR
jgi:Ser/Thr protein kinase RdoA (MazF antagonist)